jgi:sulfite reductase (ferredoxin)
MIDDLTGIPSHDEDASYYRDWADGREFTTGDMGVGECAGEVVAPTDFQLTACEREAFEAQLKLEAGEIDAAAKIAYESMLHAAVALLKLQIVVAPEDPDRIVAEFQEHFYDTQLFFDPFTGGKFAQYFFQAHGRRGGKYDAESAHYLIEEAQLFIEAAHSCYARMIAQPAAASA